MASLLQQLTNGLAVGCVYALIGIGFVLIYKATHIVNFAHGEFMTAGAFLLYAFGNVIGLGYVTGALLAVVSVALAGTLVGGTVVRHTTRRHVLAGVIVTVAIAAIVNNGIRMIPGWGAETYAVSSPFADTVIRLGVVVVSGHHLTIAAVAIALVMALQLFLTRTRRGLGIRALSEDKEAALQLGVPVANLLPIIWAVAAGIAALAGVLLAPALFVHAELGILALHAFPAAVLGGFVSIPGTIIGGIIVGVVEELAGFYLPEGFKNVAPHLILISALVWRPYGLLSSRPTVHL